MKFLFVISARAPGSLYRSIDTDLVLHAMSVLAPSSVTALEVHVIQIHNLSRLTFKIDFDTPSHWCVYWHSDVAFHTYAGHEKNMLGVAHIKRKRML